MRSMATAPKDGTRILVLNEVTGYDPRELVYVKTQVVEVFWYDAHMPGRWSEWLGNHNMVSITPINPIGWWPLSSLNFNKVE